MSFINTLSDTERSRCLDVLTEVVRIRTHLDLFNWVRGGILHFLPHDILLAAWGDFERGEIQHDIVSPLKDVRTIHADVAVLKPRLRDLFMQWAGAHNEPITVPAQALHGAFSRHPLRDPLQRATPPVRTALVHGLHDRRGQQDCLYVLLSHTADPATAQAFSTLLPYIDTALRQVPILPAMAGQPDPSGSSNGKRLSPQAPQITIRRDGNGNGNGVVGPDTGMTEREMQIMRWVEMGKTNQEIGTILDISAFTVKNHLQRIFKKLDVYSRAHAVSRFKDSMIHG